MAVRAGRGVAAWTGEGEEFQLWVGKREGEGAEGYAKWAIVRLGMTVAGRIARVGEGGAACVEGY